MRSSYWQNLTTRDFAGVDPESTIAMLPVAAVEQHGPHLPLGTDAMINAGLVREMLARLVGPPAVLVLPALDVGHSPEHGAFAGTLSAGVEPLLALWGEVGRCAARSGIRKLVILNTHGGQKALVDLAAVRLRVEYGLLAVRASYFSFGAPPGLFDERELAHGLHGGDVETSLMLHLHPELVRAGAVADFDGLPAAFAERNETFGPGQAASFGWMSQDLHPEGVSGRAAAASAEKGRRYLDYVADRLVKLIGEVAATPLDVLQPGPLQR